MPERLERQRLLGPSRPARTAERSSAGTVRMCHQSDRFPGCNSTTTLSNLCRLNQGAGRHTPELICSRLILWQGHVSLAPLIVEQLDVDGTLRTFQMQPSTQGRDIVVAFADEYEDRRSGP